MKTSGNGIGLFGGTFDPIHNGHLMIAEWLTEFLEIETTYFIPAKIHPFDKRPDITDEHHRLKMLQVVLEDYPKFALSEFETLKEEVSYSVDTIHHFSKNFPKKVLYFFIGSDNLDSFLKWKEPMEILKICHIVVYNRSNSINENDLYNHPKVISIPTPIIEISSSQIRRRVARQMPFKSLVPKAVFEYINQNKLYHS